MKLSIIMSDSTHCAMQQQKYELCQEQFILMKYWTREVNIWSFKQPLKTYGGEIITLSLVYLDEDELR